MNKMRKMAVLFFPILIIGVFLTLRFWAQQQCTEREGEVFTEDFDTDTYKDATNSAIANWPTGPISLNHKGENFEITEPAGMGAKIYVCDAGDFDGDGRPDLIGLDIGTDSNYRLILVRNLYEDLNGDKIDDDGIIFRVDPTEVYGTGFIVGPASITVADYNKDGLLDFFFYKNRDDAFSYNQFVAAMFINKGTPTNPDFSLYNQSPNLDFTDKFKSKSIYCNWAADHLCSTDIDKDGDTDILVISQDKIFLVRNPGTENFNLNNFEIAELNYNEKTGFTTGRGGSSVDAGDFDNDGDIDIVGGSVMNIPYLVYYQNDGMGHFTRMEIAIPNSSCTGTVATCVASFKNDGWKDIFVATDRWNAGNEARMWMMKNRGLVDGQVDWEFKCYNNCEPILPEPHDVDMSSCLDYDGDGDYDVILADANHSGDYYLIINQLAPVYALHGVAQWTNVTKDILDPREFAITRVQITYVQQGVLGGSSDGLTVNFEVSNNGGQDWEPYNPLKVPTFSGSEINNASDLPIHSFNTFGAQLKWRAFLDAPEDSMEEYDLASYETPIIGEIQLKYWYVERREYSRASAAATIVEPSGQKKKLIIGSSFIFPGWEGQLRAYDVTGLALTGGQYSSLKMVTASDLGSASGRTVASGVDIFWDAGQILNDRSPDDRTVYTVLRSGASSPYTWTRTDFTRANAVTLGPKLQDSNNDNAGLIDFVRGQGRYWKLGDINHSSPVVVGPPHGEATVMGTGYAEFKQTWASRTKVLYVGGNDGMLHCFDINTGEEIWAFIPYNLLPKLRNMWAVDAATGQRYYAHDIYVDGTPSVADVYISSQWKTVLVCGQGPGKGSTMAGGTNYYFALDITDPQNPVPMWEVTETYMGESWSVPAIGKVNQSGTAQWVAFMGSGYDNVPGSPVMGNWFYVVRIDNGTIIQTVSVSNVNTNSKYPDIYTAFPGSPTAIDTDQNSFINFVYIGDLDGRLYRMDVASSMDPASWNLTAIYTDYLYYPIITKPAVWIDPLSGTTTRHIYFGTGGDDRAPADGTYSFVGLTDAGGGSATVEWFLGDPTVLNLPAGQDVGDLETGDKAWADPVISDFMVYFSTLQGSIENNNPCLNLDTSGKLFSRYIRNVAGVPVGGTAFKTSETIAPEYLQMVSKARRAVTVGEVQRVSGHLNKREIYIQEYDSTIELLEQPIGPLLKVKSWREIYKIIR